MDLKSDVLTLQNQCPKVNPSVSKISLPLHLREDSYPQGWNKREKIIPERGFLSAGMKSARKNHLWERIFIRRDETSEEESSMREDFYPQRWNKRGRIIPERDFLSAGMKQARKNHPWERIFIRRDEISEEGSSLREDSYPQGWNQRRRIIPEREFLSAGMKSARKNHPCERIFIYSAGRSEERRVGKECPG